jgi:hypothetical protein
MASSSTATVARQYTSAEFGEVCDRLGVVQSMGATGVCFDCEHDGVAVQAGLTLVSNDFVSLR